MGPFKEPFKESRKIWGFVVKRKSDSKKTTPPYSPHTNGLIERPNRALMDKVRCLLIDSQLSHIFWADAFLHAVSL